LRIQLDATVLNIDSPKRTIIATTEKADSSKLKRLKHMKNVDVVITPVKDSRVDLNYLFEYLADEKIDSVLVEGGSALNYSVFREGLADKVVSFIAPMILGGENSKTPVGGEGFERLQDAVLLKDMSISRFDDDIMVEAYVRKDKSCLQD
jgi:diaminohydroxyphosphoribosylaminopyrimidine deaminase/5-amino-6-(5-phosphoribosylamino)uracil reductase